MIDVCAVIEQETGQRVTPETRLDAMGLDSLDFLNLMVACSVPDEKVADLNTVGDIIHAVCD
jgi:acyl carrier protein